MAIYRGSGGANEATDAATNQAAAAAEYARQASESALDTQALYDTFDDTYLGSKPSAPTLDNHGDALAIGALYFDSVENKLKVYSDIGWIDSAVASPSSFTSQAFSGTGVQTVFTLSTAPSSIQSLLVFVSGLRLRPTLDYTVASTTLTFAVAPANATNNISVLVVTTLAVGTPDDNSVSTAKIQHGAVSLDKLAIDSVDSSKIINGTIVVADLNASVLVASNVSNTPAGNIVATNVQTALNELDTEKVSLAGGSLTGLLNVNDGADIASASTVDLTTATGNTVRITGTTPITAFTMNAGQQMELVAVGALPLTYHATTMNINGGASYTCAAGDRLSVSKDGAGVIRVNVTKQDGTAVVTSSVGRVLAQSVTFQTGAMATGTTVIPFDNSIPQNTEGDERMVLAITPTNALSTLEIEVVTNAGASAAGIYITTALFQDSTANALSAEAVTCASANYMVNKTLKHSMTAGTTSLTTFKVRMGVHTASTLTFNGVAGGQIFNGVMASRITVNEYLP